MSHYTSITTKYTNLNVLKKVINKLGYPYTEQNLTKKIEVSVIHTKDLKSSIYDSYSQNYLAFQSTKSSYDMITDSQSWTQKEIINIFLNKLELNYGYLETINQALELGFIRSKVTIANNNNNRFIFQRCVEVKS